jgi:hydrogenase/urease accessory protein HupE
MGGSPLATIRLSGLVPPAAQHLSWKYSWTFASYAFIARRGANATVTEWLEGGATSKPLAIADVTPPVSRLRLAGRYIVLGFTHILPKGIDHVLFVLGLFLLRGRARQVLLQITAFTVAHSITLALSMYGLASVPSSIVEPAIALSIAYIALENVFTSDLTRWRYVLVFAFGLLHGLGFAGALAEVGLPRAEFLTALLAFNAGVELGQLTVIGAAFALVGYWFSDRPWYRQRIVLPASACIACVGIYWTLERLRYIA